MLTRNSTGSNQRRSSILKPPKSRLPFQDLDFNASSAENSPDSIKRRRVSFAEKKHVKEFCDHKEQGTIWDSTYEEADQNISKSTETTNEHINSNNLDTENNKNVGIEMRQMGATFVCNEHELIHTGECTTMDQNNAIHSLTKVFSNTAADIEFTDVIPCSHGNLNNLMSQTIFCQDVDLDTTETVGGIEQTVSVRRAIDSQSTYTAIAKDVHNPESTVLFDDSDGEMKFTQVISGKKIQFSTPIKTVPHLEQMKMASPIENQTIIFDDSMMDLTLTKSHSNPDLRMKNNMMISNSTVAHNDEQHMKNNLESNCDMNEREVAQASNKTMFFDDFSCDVTKAIDTMRHMLPVENLAEDKLTPESNERQTPCNTVMDISAEYQGNHVTFMTKDISILSKHCDHELKISKKSEEHTAKLRDKTIFFNDIGCEMTEAIDTLRTGPDQIRNSDDTNDMQHIIPFELSVSKNHEGMAKLRDKTIFCNDIACEMTEAIDTLRTGPDQNTNSGDTSDMQRITPFESPMSKQHEDKLMLPEFKGSTNLSSSSKPSSIEPALELVIENNDGKNSFNDSCMECTIAITASKNVQDDRDDDRILEINQPALLNKCTINTTQINPELNVEEHITSLGSDSISVIIESEESQNEGNRMPKESTRNIESNEYCDSSNNERAEHDAGITSSPSIALYTPNAQVSLKEQDLSFNAGIIPTELQFSKKRKSDKGTEIMETSKSSVQMLLNKNSESCLVQHLVDKELFHISNDSLSNIITPEPKRLKVTSPNAEKNGSLTKEYSVTENSALQENTSSEMISGPPSRIAIMHEPQSTVSMDRTIGNNCITDVAEKKLQSSEEMTTTIPTPDFCEDPEILIVSQNDESKAAASPTQTEGVISGKEYPFIEAKGTAPYSDSDSDTTELQRVYEKQKQASVECNKSSQSFLLPEKCLEYNDNCLFVMFSEELEKYAQRDDCIWEIRSLDTEKVMIDFISKSLVIIIDLEANKELTAPYLIKHIRIISLLPDSADDEISLVHNILLKKLDPEHLKLMHRTTQGILPLLELISKRVKLLIDFMYEFDKLRDFHAITRLGNRISFQLHSYKVQLVINVTINLEPFENIRPDDVTVECLLGTIKEKDIKQLITGVKKDHRFLTSWIDAVKEYIALVVEK
ncbi:uncharacterized protein LOC124414365 [Diprion similis]|uniref:uncharacterized protein LOC124414365 n=1 Tax=Diprion similis TaxID=362088 RepID=UPI001EF84719|nr:uncharacterized protein LOC124414365 [Diprion similis]